MYKEHLLLLYQILRFPLPPEKEDKKECLITGLFTWGSCFTCAMGATTAFIMSDRVCLASSGTIGSRPGFSWRPRMVTWWLPGSVPLNEAFWSPLVFSALDDLSPFGEKDGIRAFTKENQLWLKEPKQWLHPLKSVYWHAWCFFSNYAQKSHPYLEQESYNNIIL